jgi:TRAP-type C4-dicarboxylate transport system substrate-binding protein
VKLDIKFGGYQEPASIHNRAAARFGQLLTQILGDGVGFELIGSILKLGRPAGDLVPMVERGELSFCYMSTVRFSRAAPELQLLELPFVVKDRSTVWRALDGEYGQIATRHVNEQTACRLLGYWDNGFRHLSNRVRPIRHPDDCRGIRIRTQMSDLHGEVFRALGFEPIASDIKEFVEQIGGDRFQAQDNPLTNIYNFGVHNHHRYITLTSHFFGASFLIANARGMCAAGAPQWTRPPARRSRPAPARRLGRRGHARQARPAENGSSTSPPLSAPRSSPAVRPVLVRHRERPIPSCSLPEQS